jgi:hypothetical protein
MISVSTHLRGIADPLAVAHRRLCHLHLDVIHAARAGGWGELAVPPKPRTHPLPPRPLVLSYDTWGHVLDVHVRSSTL